jgi:hypothetical protein
VKKQSKGTKGSGADEPHRPEALAFESAVKKVLAAPKAEIDRFMAEQHPKRAKNIRDS